METTSERWRLSSDGTRALHRMTISLVLQYHQSSYNDNGFWCWPGHVHFPPGLTTHIHPQMSILAALPTLLLLSSSAIAGISAPNCLVMSTWNWVRNYSFPDILSTADGLLQTFNSLNQNPCLVAAFLQSTCNMGCECSSRVYEHGSLISCSVYCRSPSTGILVL